MPRVTRVAILVALLAPALLAGCSSAPDWPPPRGLTGPDALTAYLDEQLAAELERAGLVGLGVSVVDGGEIVYARGFGRADREGRVAATPVTDYRVGSLSKPFTSVLVMQLVEAGKVDLDAPLADYLPGFVIGSRFGGTGPVTVRQLMTHRAGIPNLWTRIGPDGEPVRFDAAVADLGGAWLTHPPGSVTKYSSEGYDLLGALVEAVTDRTFEEFARTSLLEPIGARTASFSLDPADHPQLARAYRGSEPVPALPSLAGQIPSGGLNANVVDLARFMRLFLGRGTVDGRQVLGEAMVDSLLAPAPELPLDFDDRPGLAWFHTALPDLEAVGPVLLHGGSTFLYHSRMILHPGTGVGVAVCTNTASGRDAVERIAHGTLAAALSRYGDVSRRPARSTSRPTPVDHFEPYAGRYQTQVGLVDVDPAGGEAKLLGKSFQLRPERGRWMSLEHVILGSIRVSIPDLEGLRFTFTDVEGTAVLLVDDGGRRTRLGERVEAAPASEAWLARTGKYELVDPGSAGAVMFAKSPALDLRAEGGSLVVHTHPAVHPSVKLTWLLSPVSDTEAVFAGISSYLGGETLAVVRGADGEERLRLWGYDFARAR